MKLKKRLASEGAEAAKSATLTKRERAKLELAKRKART